MRILKLRRSPSALALLALLALLGALLVGLSSTAPARGAEQLVETVTVPPTIPARNGVFTTMSYQAGERLTLEVSGTVTETFGPTSGFAGTRSRDALYCFASAIPGNCPQPTLNESLNVFDGGGFILPFGVEEAATGPTRTPYSPSHVYRDTSLPSRAGRLMFVAAPNGTPTGGTVFTGGFEVKIFRTTAEEPPGLCPRPATRATQAGASEAGQRAQAVNEVRVVAVQPEVSVHKAGTPEDQWVEVTRDTVLQQGDEISADPDGAATFQFADNSTVVVKDTTQFKIGSFFTEGGVVRTEILLRMGQIEATLPSRESDARRSDFRIKSPTGCASVRGTRFTVFVDPGSGATTTSVQRGTVAVDPLRAGLATRMVTAGREVEVTRTAISPVARVGRTGLRGGLGRRGALVKVGVFLRRAERPCQITTALRFRANVFAIAPAPNGWRVRVSVLGPNRGASQWLVAGGRATPANALARRLANRCR